MRNRTCFRRTASSVPLLLISFCVFSGNLSEINPRLKSEIDSILSRKAYQSASDKKINSQLKQARDAILQERMGKKHLKSQNQATQEFIKNNIAQNATVKIVIRTRNTPLVMPSLLAAGAKELNEDKRYQTITARVPISKLNTLALNSKVSSIEPFLPPITNREALTPDAIHAWHERHSLSANLGPISHSGSIASQGVIAHGADKVHQSGITGQGQKVCVLSDGVDSMSNSINTGDLPSNVDVVSGQAGSGSEGTAMLEIVYDMAPGANLGFASGFNGETQMATNIATLDTVKHCTIIVDDVTYFLEPPFQEGVIANAVTTATGHGKPYFSSAANSGNFYSATSGTWEGDFSDAGPAPAVVLEMGRAHSFGASIFNVLTHSSGGIFLTWSDPQNASSNDYDLFIVNAAETALLAHSVGNQSGSQSPYEYIYPANSIPVGSKILIVKYRGDTRALRIDTQRGQLSMNTSGNTYGHNGGVNSTTVAAVDVGSANGGIFSGGAANPVEYFSSDGARRIFYSPVPSTSPLTYGNLLFGTNGGTLLNKVDFTAANGVSTTLPRSSGLNPFYGTSAAAPHAASIAALVMSAKPDLTISQLNTALKAGSLDIGPLGYDVTTGSGLIRADLAVRSVLSPIEVSKAFSPNALTKGSISRLSITLNNLNQVDLKGVSLADNFPANLNVSTPPNSSFTGTGCLGSVSTAGGGNSLSLSNATIPSQTSCTLSVDVTSNIANTYFDTSGQVTTPIGLNTSAGTASLTILQGLSDQTISLAGSILAYQGTATLSATGTTGSGAISYNLVSGASSCAISGNVLTGLSPGSCMVTASIAADTNYNAATSAPSVFTVNKADQSALSLSANPTSISSGDKTLMATQGGSGLGMVSFSATKGGALTSCVVSGGTLTAIGSAGACYVVATKQGDSNYNSTSSPVVVVNVGKRGNPIKLELRPSTVVIGSSAKLNVLGGSGKGSVSYSILETSGTTCKVVGNEVRTSVTSGTCTLTATKSADASYQSTTSSPARLVITKASQKRLSVTVLSKRVRTGTSLMLSTSGGSGSGIVSYAITKTSGKTLCTLNKNILSITGGAGICGIMASKAEDLVYKSTNSAAVEISAR